MLSNSRRGLRALDLAGVQSRNDFTLRQIAEAVADTPSLPHFAPVLIWTGDRPIENLGETHLAYSIPQSGDLDCIAVPDFVFTGWPEAGIETFWTMASEIEAASLGSPAVGKVGWRGNVRTSPRRAEMEGIARSHPRLFDFQDVDVASLNARTAFLSMSEQSRRFAALMDVEGVGYSGRWKLQMLGLRPVIWVERPFVEFWHGSLPPAYESLRVDRDLRNLVAVAEFALHDPRASAIQQEVHEFSRRHFTSAHVNERWRQVLQALPGRDRPFAQAVWRVLSPWLN